MKYSQTTTYIVSVFAFTSVAAVTLGVGVLQGALHLEWHAMVQAASSMPDQDGGTITYVQQGCVIEDPVFEPNVCHTCPACTALLQSGCALVEELQVTSQYGTTVLCPEKGFPYMGGGIVPRVGSQYIYGGASEIAPWIIGIPK